MTGKIKKGDIVLVNLNPVQGSEAGRTRPCVIIQNDIGNQYAATTIIAIVTSQKDISREYPTDVWISKEESALDLDSIIQCDQIRTIDKKRIIKKIGHLSQSIMKKVNRAILVSLDLSF
jgi:mRNA interferase MazF